MNKKQFQAIFADVLLPHGYSVAKDRFFRREGEVFRYVALDKSSFGGSFTVYIGVYVDEGATLSQPPPYYETHLRQCLHCIVPQSIRDQLLPACDLEVAMGAEERSAIIKSVLEEYGLPYLSPLSTLEGIADYLSPERRNFAGVTLALREIIKRRTGREQAV